MDDQGEFPYFSRGIAFGTFGEGTVMVRIRKK